jgi:hypothetical protein
LFALSRDGRIFPFEQSLDGVCLFDLPVRAGMRDACADDNANTWRIQKERQQRVAREFGRIGYIGNSGPAVGGGFP